MAIAAGSLVTILPPFNGAFPDSYPVIYVFPDGSAAVMVPGWVQVGDSFDPSQGANFAAAYIQDTGNTVDLSTLIIPTVPSTRPPPKPSVAVTSTSTPALNGTYAIDDTTRANIQAVAIYINTNAKFPAGLAQLPWPDIGGAAHTFPTTAAFMAFASAIGDYYTALTLGLNPTQPISIP